MERPYSTWLSLGSSVVHEMVAPVEVMFDEEMEEVVGGVVSGGGMVKDMVKSLVFLLFSESLQRM